MTARKRMRAFGDFVIALLISAVVTRRAVGLALNGLDAIGAFDASDGREILCGTDVALLAVGTGLGLVLTVVLTVVIYRRLQRRAAM